MRPKTGMAATGHGKPGMGPSVDSGAITRFGRDPLLIPIPHSVSVTL